MIRLSNEDVNTLAKQLAPLLIEQVKQSHHEFWIDPESHYNSHKAIEQLDTHTVVALKDMVTEYKAAKGIFWKVFIGALSLGGLVAAGWALFTKQ